MKILETKRLILRNFTENDIETLTEINQDPKVCEFLPAIGTRDSTEKLIKKIIEHNSEHGFSLYAVELKSTQEMIGWCGLMIPSFEAHFTPAVEIGWRLASNQWNQGYATEAAIAILEYAFKNLKLKEIVSFTAAGNIRSRRVMEKIGLHHDLLDDFDHPKIEKSHPLCRHVLYRISSDELIMDENQGKSYDLIADDFAKMRDSFYKEKKYIDLFMSYLKPQSHVLDIGCGSGHPIASYLIEHDFQVTGVDGSKKLLEIANQKCPKMKSIYGDIRTVDINTQFDGIIEWWCLFHLPKQDHQKMITRFARWLKKDGILQFTTGDSEYDDRSSAMLNQELRFYSLTPAVYEKYLIENNFKILLCEADQDQHLVWTARYEP